MKASIKEVAQLAGVSVATVSNVLNGTKNVLPGTRKKVLDAVAKLNYTINPLARNFRRGESKLIGFVVSNLSNYFFQDIAAGIERRLTQNGYRLALMDCKENKAAEIENVRNLLGSSVDGLIIATTTDDCSYLNLLLEDRDIPVVFVDRSPTGFESDLVLSTNADGSYEAVRYLIEKGYRSIGFVGSRVDSTMNERAEGYRKALKEAGIPVNENFIRMGDTKTCISQREQRHGFSYSAARELLENGVTAILTGNNLASVGAFSYIRERNLKVPEEVAFVTYDDSFWLTMTTPSLSAVAQDPERIGDTAAVLMLGHLGNARNRTHRTIRIPTQLIPRNSC